MDPGGNDTEHSSGTDSTLAQVSNISINTVISLTTSIETNILEILDDILGIVERVNSAIDQYLPFFELTSGTDGKSYIASNLNKEFSIFNSAIKPSTSDSTFISFPNSTRKLTSWMQEMAKYTNDGIYDLGYIYIGKELGINSVPNSTINKQYISRCNELIDVGLRNGINKSLWKKEIFNSAFISINEYEGILWQEYKIKINENAKYEKVLGTMKTEVPSLSEVDNLDLSELVEGNISVLSDEYNTLIKKIEFLFLKDILFVDDIPTKCASIKKLFDSTDSTFKMLVLKRGFVEAIKDILNYEKAKAANSSEYIQLNSLYLSMNEEIPDSEYCKTDDSIFKYQALWIFKYGKSDNILQYVDESDKLGKSFYEYINTRDNSNDETSDDEELEAQDKTTESVVSIWQKLVDGITAIFSHK